jgi:hypothetical protein
MAGAVNKQLGQWLHDLSAEQRAAIGVIAVDYESLSDHVHRAILLNLERVGIQSYDALLDYSDSDGNAYVIYM